MSSKFQYSVICHECLCVWVWGFSSMLLREHLMRATETLCQMHSFPHSCDGKPFCRVYSQNLKISPCKTGSQKDISKRKWHSREQGLFFILLKLVGCFKFSFSICLVPFLSMQETIDEGQILAHKQNINESYTYSALKFLNNDYD